jgi:hypoxanthine phosphoribosyltransferase
VIDPEGLVHDTLLDEAAIQARIVELGAEITRDYEGREPLLVCVLKGGFIFLADLVRHIDLPVAVDFMAISSYGAGTRSSGVVRILKDLETPIEGRDVLVVEDIVDSGLTLGYLMRNLGSRRPASLDVCALLTKPARREIEVPIRYVGFEIPDRFVVGYGLDFDERYRNLRDIGVVDESRLDG